MLRPLAGAVAKAGGTANHVTVAACLLSWIYGVLLLAFPACAALWFGLAPFLFLRMALNAIDGILAREHGQKSRLGALLNEMGDVLADAALFVPLALVPQVSGWAVTLFVWMALLTEFAGVLALLVAAPRRYDGPMGKSDRAFCIGLAGLVIGTSLLRSWNSAPVLTIGLLVGSALMALTTSNRLRRALNSPGAV